MRRSSSETSSSRLAERLRVTTWSLILVFSIVWVLQLFFVISTMGRPGQNASGFDASMMLTGIVTVGLLVVAAVGWGVERHHPTAAAAVYGVVSGAGLVAVVVSLVILMTSAG